MDHPFLTRRHDLERATRGLELAGDLRILGMMTQADHARVLSRRDPQVSCNLVRGALERHAGRLGMLLEDLDALCDGASSLAHRHAKTWSSFVEAASPLPDGFWRDVEAAAMTLRTLRDEVSPVEQDDASSSYSDYSDSDTESTESSGSEEEEDEESEEEPKKPASKKTPLSVPKGLLGKRKPK